MSERFRRIFQAARPVIAMAHLPALPGTPLHDAAAGIQGAVDAVPATSRSWSTRASTP